MSGYLLETYYNAVECYVNLESRFHQLSHQEILESLRSCLNNLDHVLCAEISENSIYFMVIVNLKRTVLDNISQMEKLCNKPSKAVDNAECTKKETKQDVENRMFGNIVESTILKPRTKGLCDIAGLSNIKNILRTYVISPVHQPQLYEGLKYSNCLLLFGPPGTGKTRLVDAISVDAGATLLYATVSSILSQYVGQSEKILRSLFQYIYGSDKQTILFIDEIDGLCRQRVQNESEHSRRLKTEFMCQLSSFEDSQKGFLICATNCPWELDVAFVRRFQKRLYVPLPDCNERYDLLKHFTQNTPLENTFHLWEPIVQATEGFSGSDMVQLVQQALTIPILQLQKNKVWKLVDDSFYETLSLHDGFDGSFTIHYSEFSDLPANSVRARKACIDDLTDALHEVKRSVSEEYVKKYESYVNNYVKY